MRIPKLQLHLSTCIALMFVAGGLLWANMRGVEIHVHAPMRVGMGPGDSLEIDSDEMVGFNYGWPEPALIDDHRVTLEEIQRTIKGLPNSPYSWNSGGLCIDAFNALAILAATAFLCEWLLRRRARSQEPGARS